MKTAEIAQLLLIVAVVIFIFSNTGKLASSLLNAIYIGFAIFVIVYVYLMYFKK